MGSWEFITIFLPRSLTLPQKLWRQATKWNAPLPSALWLIMRLNSAHLFQQLSEDVALQSLCDSPFVQQLQFDAFWRHHPPEATVVTVYWEGEALVILWWKKMQRSETSHTNCFRQINNKCSLSLYFFLLDILKLLVYRQPFCKWNPQGDSTFISTYNGLLIIILSLLFYLHI